jgi:anti-sigma factor RsiW
MLWCFIYRKSLSAYLDGGLSSRRCAALEGHLATCNACRAVLEDLRAIEPALLTLDAPPPPPYMVSRILAEARQRQRGEVSRRTFRRGAGVPAILRRALAGATAALFLGIAAGCLVGWHWSRSETTIPLLSQASEPDPLEGYSLDYLGDTPAGSLADCYLTLFSEPQAEGE